MAGKKTIEVQMVEGIGYWGYSLSSLREQLRDFEGDEIIIPINSFGGEYFEALAIHNYLKGRKEKKVARILAVAASAATFIAIAADEIEMPENGYFMIHNPWGGAFGDADDMESSAAMMRSITENAAKMYSKHTGSGIQEIRDMMDAETWLTAKDAKKMGFITKITSAVTVQNSIKPETLVHMDYKNVPGELVNQKKETMNLFDSVKAFFKATGKDVNTEEEALKALQEGAENPGLSLDAVKAEMKAGMDAAIKSATDAIRTEMKADVLALTAKVGEIVDAMATMNAQPDAVEDVADQVDEMQAAINDLSAKMAAMNARKSGIAPKSDATPPVQKPGEKKDDFENRQTQSLRNIVSAAKNNVLKN
jgi:ATP-dependent Clp protease, protease subunit